MTTMTPSIRQIPKLIFHDVDPGDPPPAPLSGLWMRWAERFGSGYFLLFFLVHQQFKSSRGHNFLL